MFSVHHVEGNCYQMCFTNYHTGEKSYLPDCPVPKKEAERLVRQFTKMYEEVKVNQKTN